MIAAKKKIEVGLVVTDPAPMRMAELFLEAHFRHPEGLTLRFWNAEWYRFRPDLNRSAVVTNDEMERLARRFLDLVSIERRDKDGEKFEVPLNPRQRDVKEMLLALRALEDVYVTGEAPQYLGLGPVRARVIALRNGTLDLDTGELLPPTPAYFNVTSLGTHYDPAAKLPERWFDFLRTIWPDDEESQAALQEWMGYTLAPDTSLQKMAFFVGAKRTGKGTLGRVHTALLGPDSVCSPSLSSLGTTFGGWQLLNKQLAIVSDARLSAKADHGVIAERLLSISGEDAQTIDRKHLPPVTCRLPIRFAIMSNEIPRLADASGALASRFLIFRFTRSFLARKTPT